MPANKLLKTHLKRHPLAQLYHFYISNFIIDRKLPLVHMSSYLNLICGKPNMEKKSYSSFKKTFFLAFFLVFSFVTCNDNYLTL